MTSFSQARTIPLAPAPKQDLAHKLSYSLPFLIMKMYHLFLTELYLKRSTVPASFANQSSWFSELALTLGSWSFILPRNA